jgi:hypothetical protein
MRAFKRRFALIDCGRVSERTRGSISGSFSEPIPWPNNRWG